MTFRRQIIFWFIVSTSLILIFGKISEDFRGAFFIVTFLLPVMVGTSYFFNFYLVPRYLLHKRYWKFLLYMIYTLIISIYLEMIVVTLAFVYLANYQYKNMDPVTTNIYVLLVTLYLIVFAKGFVLFLGKLYGYNEKIKELTSEKKKMEQGFLVVKSNRQSRKISFNELLYVESLGDYVKIILSEGDPVVSKETISSIKRRLPNSFIRTHRSFVVNLDKIEGFNAEEITIRSITLPISRTYKKEVIEKLS